MSYRNRNRREGGGSYGSRGSGFGSSYMNQGPKPVEVGKEYDVEVTELSRRGDGVAKMQGFVVFVKGAKVGDKTKIRVETVGPRFATAIALGTTGVKTDEGDSSSSSSSGESIAKPI
jgi:predicted RNA-binding protein with TRAM domain